MDRFHKRHFVDKAFLLRLWEALRSKTPVLQGDFNHPDIHWESSKASFRSLLDDFWSQVTERSEILDPVIISMSKLTSRLKAGWVAVIMHLWSLQI